MTDIQTPAANPSDVFSWTRFAAFFRAHVRVNRQQILSGCLMVFIGIFVTFCIGEIFNKWRIYLLPSPVDPMWNDMAFKAMFLLFLFTTLGASVMFSSMSNKSSRLSTLVLPASSLEKFLTYFLVYIVGTAIVFCISVFLADLLRVAWISLFTPYGSEASLCPLNYWLFHDRNPSDSDYCVFSVIFSMFVTLQALFALGSILWKKLSFIKTTGALFAINMVISMSVMWMITHFFPYGFMSSDLEPETSVATAVKIGLAGIAVAALIYWLTYARFREDEIIDRW